MADTAGRAKGHKEGVIGWIVFDNPAKLNAVSPAMRTQAHELALDYEADPEIRVIILRGSGEKSFVSGADISAFDSEKSPSATRDVSFTELSSTLRNLTKPTIAMVHGYCLGGGLELALNTDLRFGSTLSQWGIPAALRGIAYPVQAVRQLLTVVSPCVAKDLLYSGRRLHAFEALNVGLANQVFPPEQLYRETVAYAVLLAENAPLSIQSAKFLIDQFMLDPSERDCEAMQAKVNAASHSKDFREATLAFAEKRKPVFQGK